MDDIFRGSPIQIPINNEKYEDIYSKGYRERCLIVLAPINIMIQIYITKKIKPGQSTDL